MKIPTFEGIMTVVTTPFDGKGEIDFGVLGKHLHYLLEQGVHWIVPGGTTGEYFAQTTEERKRVLSFVTKGSSREGPPGSGDELCPASRDPRAIHPRREAGL